MTRARQVANFDPALFAADEISGDKVHGGTISGSPTLVTPNLGTPSAVTLTSATYPTGTVENVTIYKYALSSNASYQYASDTYAVITRTSSSVNTVQSITVETGYTYYYEYQWWHTIWQDSGTPKNRTSVIHLQEGTTNHTQGTTDPAGNILARTLVGRDLIGTSAENATGWHAVSLVGAKYYTTSETRYVWLNANANGGYLKIEAYMDATYPMYLKISKIKGDVLNTIT